MISGSHYISSIAAEAVPTTAGGFAIYNGAATPTDEEVAEDFKP
jgi:hypothetical protein